MQHTSACYGRMFPATLVKTENQEVKGRVFGYRVDHTGVVETGRATTVDRAAWQECTQCHDVDTCFRLSAGTLLMELAVRT